MKTTEELKNLLYKNETVADAAPDAIAAAQDFCEGYKTFLDNAKTEREATAYSEKLLTARRLSEVCARHELRARRPRSTPSTAKSACWPRPSARRTSRRAST